MSERAAHTSWPDDDEYVSRLMDAHYSQTVCNCDDDIGKTCGFCESTRTWFHRVLRDAIVSAQKDLLEACRGVYDQDEHRGHDGTCFICTNLATAIAKAEAR